MTIGEHIRKYALSYGHEVSGKLTRRYDLERIEQEKDDEKRKFDDLPPRKLSYKIFTDDAENEYYFFPKKKSTVVVTADGGVF